MDAVRYLKEKSRMTEGCCIPCEECQLSFTNNVDFVGCTRFEHDCPEKAVEIVMKWSEKHPQKTYLMDFLEKYPNCKKRNSEIPESCRYNIYGKQSDYCSESCEKCWNEPMED